MFGVAEEVKVGVKSQVVIPARIREDAQVRPGDILIMTRQNWPHIGKSQIIGHQLLMDAAKMLGGISQWSIYKKNGKQDWDMDIGLP